MKQCMDADNLHRRLKKIIGQVQTIDRMVDEDGSPFTAHTTNPVPFCVAGYSCQLREGGRLADIAPTMLQILGLPQPEEMDGKTLIQE